MMWEITIISLLVGMLIGIVGTILAVKVKDRIDALEKKTHETTAIEKDLAAVQKMLEKQEQEQENDKE